MEFNDFSLYQVEIYPKVRYYNNNMLKESAGRPAE